LKILFVVAALVMILLGVAWLVFPDASLASWGIAAEPGTVYLARRYGVLFFGYAVILLCARDVEEPRARRALLLGNAVVNGAMALASVGGALTHVVAPSVLGAAVVEGLLAAAFAYQLVKGR